VVFDLIPAVLPIWSPILLIQEKAGFVELVIPFCAWIFCIGQSLDFQIHRKILTILA